MLLFITLVYIDSTSLALTNKISLGKTQCEITEYKNNLYWDVRLKHYWSQQGFAQASLHTCDINSCTEETQKTGEIYKGCYARPDNTNHCRLPCYVNKHMF